MANTSLPKDAPADAAVVRDDRFPPGIPYIVGNEGAERFSYYGMRAILKVYLLGLFLRFVDEKIAPAADVAEATARSTSIYHLFVAAVYAFPLVGAIIADRWLGKFRVIFWVSMIYCAGHAALAVAGRLGEMDMFTPAEWGMYIGLALIAVGSGGIKPCVSANVGDQFSAKNGHLVPRVFQIFYFIINYGSFFSTLLTPLLRRWFGPEVAFGVPGVLMAIATFVFWLGRNKFAKVPPNPGGTLGLLDSVATLLLLGPLLIFAFGGILPAVADFVWMTPEQTAALLARNPAAPVTLGAVLLGRWPLYVAAIVSFGLGWALFLIRQRRQPGTSFLPVLTYAVMSRKARAPGQRFFDLAREKFGSEAGDGPPAVLRIMVVFVMVSVFWALFDQHGSTWIDQAKMMNLTITIPAMIARWGMGAVVVLSGYAGVWLFCWIGNRPLPRRITLVTVGLVSVLGVVAAMLDAVHPTGAVGPDGLASRFSVVQLDPAQLSALNPLMVMLIIPALNVFVYNPLRRFGIEPKPLKKMVVGMFLAAGAFGFSALLQQRIEAVGPGVVHGLWQAIPYFVMTTAEVLVSVTGLEFAYTQAPRAMKSTIMGFWLLCVTLGNLIVAFLAPLQKSLALSSFFLVFAGLMAVAAALFALLSATYKGRTYLQH